MPKVTIEGGPTNALEPVECTNCGAQVAPGAPACPECRSTEYVEPDAGEPEDAAEAPAQDDGTGEPEESAAPAGAAVASPSAPPRVPPRRSA